MQVPATVAIPEEQTAAAFDITVLDDCVYPPDARPVTIRATAVDFGPADATIQVL